MAALTTVQDFIDEARVLLQDTQSGAYRYSDGELVSALNTAMLEAYRVRPDLFMSGIRMIAPVTFSAGSPAVNVGLPYGYRSAFLYYITGRMELRDAEPTQDSRAASLMNKFVAQLQTIQS